MKLIFIISQPRAGSTMLQKMLAKSPDVFTTEEPWMALPVFNFAEDSLEFQAIERTLGLNRYCEKAAGFLHSCYADMAAGSGREVFLDKTPRYHRIIPRMLWAFPNEKFIFLLRHPAAVAHSAIEAWGNAEALEDDLVEAPKRIAANRDSADIVVHYERLVTEAGEVLKGICSEVGIREPEAGPNYGGTKEALWVFGDHKSVYKHDAPSTIYANAWKTSPHKETLRGIVERIGQPVFNKLGYSYEATLEILKKNS